MAQKKQNKKTPTLFFTITASTLVILVILIPLTLRTFLTGHPCANSISCVTDLSGAIDTTATTGVFMGKTISLPSMLLKDFNQKEPVLGTTTNEKKRILVDLTSQHLYAYEDNTLVYDFIISSGKFNPTPVGEFKIWTKILATRMEGGSKLNGTYYDLPNVPYTMYFYNENIGKDKGYGIHGVYWQKDFGYPATFGCIGLSIDDAKRLYYWTDPFPLTNATYETDDDPGTSIIIFGSPQS